VASFRNELEATNLKDAVRDESVRLDLWVINHFRVLPTDDRFKRLTENQKNLLFIGWLENPSSEQLKEWYDRKEDTPVITDEDAKNFEELGYRKEQIARMRDQLEKAGYRQDY